MDLQNTMSSVMKEFDGIRGQSMLFNHNTMNMHENRWIIKDDNLTGKRKFKIRFLFKPIFSKFYIYLRSEKPRYFLELMQSAALVFLDATQRAIYSSE